MRPTRFSEAEVFEAEGSKTEVSEAGVVDGFIFGYVEEVLWRESGLRISGEGTESFRDGALNCND